MPPRVLASGPNPAGAINYVLAIVFTRAAPAFEDLFNTCIWLLLDTNTVHKTAKKEAFEYLLKLRSM